jgi:hypothetical protein
VVTVSVGPISPKVHGAWLGAGAGAGIANALIQLIQSYGVHKALPLSVTALIFTVTPPLVAALGAWLAPLLPSPIKKDIAAQVALLPQPVAEQVYKREPVATVSSAVTAGGPPVAVAGSGAGGGGSAYPASNVSPGSNNTP